MPTYISNVKQVAVAFRIYAADYDDEFSVSIYPMDSPTEGNRF